MRLVKRSFGDESGATAIEYGLIAADIGLTIIRRRQQPRHYK
jgi:Flp pilus assembly pilin Flp